MKIPIAILLSILFSCGPSKKDVLIIETDLVANLITDFDSELSVLDRSDLRSIDEATELFKQYVNRTNNVRQKDSLFMPYFDLYNIGRTVLAQESDQKITQYGFKNKSQEREKDLVPIRSEYLSENVIKHFSPGMQLFCNQQLKEFEEVADLETIAINAIWWENFNVRYPDFFLRDMTVYHYNNWHLKNLISGTLEVPVFEADGALSLTAKSVYENLVENYPNTSTARIIGDYLNLLKEHKLQRSDEVQDFIESLE